MLDIDVKVYTEDILDSIDSDDIIRYCYEKKLITKKQALKVIGDESKLTLSRFAASCNIQVDPEKILEDINDDELYDWLKEDGYEFPSEEDNKPYCEYIDNREWLVAIKNHFSKMFTRVYTKEDFKKEICKAIDDYLY